MRIRQVRPEFWQDEEVASWPEGLRLFYIGLWNVADDAGYFEVNAPRISRDLYGYEPRAKRERRVTDRIAQLVQSGHVKLLVVEHGGTTYRCGHAVIPSLARHQKVGGNPAFTFKDRHVKCAVEVQTRPDKSPGNVRLGNGTLGNGARAPEGAAPPTEFRRRVPEPPNLRAVR